MFVMFTAAITLLCLIASASAGSFARECRLLADLNIDRANTWLHQTDEVCTKRVCGTVPETEVKFYERLSPQCSTLMEKYQSRWSHLGVSNQLTPHPCTSSQNATGPHGPVLISSKHPTATFAMCTIPKIGCTNFRKLLSTVMLHPDPMPADSFTQFFNPHVWVYPTVWHYEASNTSCETSSSASGCDKSVPSAPSSSRATRVPDSLPARLQSDISIPDTPGAADIERLPDSIPSFIVGRNPYVRVLSGFLDKMVHDPLRHDQWTYKSTNRNLGLDAETRWESTVASFQKFVNVLAVKGIGGQDEHFALASATCSTTFRFDYYLRLEEMEQWFPCWMQGLGLRDFTEYGWADSDDGRMHVGEGEHVITEREPWRTDQELISSVASAVAADIAQQNSLPFASNSISGVNDITSRTDSLEKMGTNATLRGGDSSDTHGTEASMEGSINAEYTGENLNLGAADSSTPLVNASLTLQHVRKSRSRVVQGDQCWWSPKGMTCTEYYASFTRPDGSVVPGGGSQDSVPTDIMQREPASPVKQHQNVQQEAGEQQSTPQTQQQNSLNDQWVTRSRLTPGVKQSVQSQTPPEPRVQQQKPPEPRVQQQKLPEPHVPPQTPPKQLVQSRTPPQRREEPAFQQEDAWQMLPEQLHLSRGLKADQHDHNAASRWQKYFDQQTADLIYLTYSEDFRVFGYERFVVSA